MKRSAIEEIKLLEKENLDRLRHLEERLKNLEKAELELERLQKEKRAREATNDASMNLPNKKMSAMEEIKLLEKENLDRLRLLEERLKNLEKAEPEFQRLQKGKNPIIAPDQPLSLELSLSQIDGGRVRKRARQEFINGRDFLGLNIGGVGAVDSGLQRVISDQTVGIAGPLGDPNLDLSLKISLTGEPKGSDDVRFPRRHEV